MSLRGRVRGGVRPLTAAALWAGLAGLYIGSVYAVVVLGGDFLTSGDGGSTALTIAAAAVVAVTFGPVSRRARRLADRLVLGDRATSLETLSLFSQGVAGVYGTDEVLSTMAQVLAAGTGAARTEVWVVVGDALRRAGAWPEPEGEEDPPSGRAVTDWPDRAVGVDLCVPVKIDDDLLGLLALAARPGRPFTAAEESLVVDLASHACLVLHNVRLSADLAARSDELAAQAEALRESRQRLIAAQTAERRRVERNIHDGAQQHLVALLVRIGLLPVLIETDEEKAVAEMAGFGPLCDDALATLTDLARGLHPRELTEDGLAAALSARLARVPDGIETSLAAPAFSRYPGDIEGAVYFACLEAVQNAIKYAACASITVDLAERDDQIAFTVVDDGSGFDTAEVARGAGMANMADRIEAMGGTFAVTSTPGAGTSVQGRLPLGERRYVTPTAPSPSVASPP